MITIKELTEQEYEKTLNKPTELVFFYRDESIEKQLIQTLYFHFAENIKEMIEYLKTVSEFKFTDKEYIILRAESKSLTIYFPEMIE